MRSLPRRVSLLAPCLQLVLLVLSVSTPWATASSPPPCLCPGRPCDSLWLVSTRALHCGDPRLHADELTYEVRDQQSHWQRSNLASFLATDDPRVTTVIWIHGNRYRAWEACSEGISTYRSLANCITCETPMRFVIFSWPSEQIKGVLDDVRVKAARSNPNGYYLAWLVDKIGGEVPVSLIGHSYGARITTGGLHLLGGGVLCGWTLDERANPDRRPIDVVLAAAAMDDHWLVPGHFHGHALSQVEHLTNIENSCDPVLERYHYLYCRRSNAEAMGKSGIAGLSRLGADRAKIQQLDANCYVGKEHGWQNYLASGPLMARLRVSSLPQAAEVISP